MNTKGFFSETADIETSSEDYAKRFSGEVGAWFLKIQENATLEMLQDFQRATILDVGGGHGQITESLIHQGHRVTVFGSAESCKERIQPFLHRGLCSFQTGSILELPFPDQSFDVVVSYRLLPHVRQWPRLIAELTRVARRSVLVDYPSSNSVNALTPLLFKFKKRMEGNTRDYTCFKEKELLKVFQENRFLLKDRFAEFFLPMVLHRMMKWQAFSSVLENLFRRMGMTDRAGSPVILKLIREGT